MTVTFKYIPVLIVTVLALLFSSCNNNNNNNDDNNDITSGSDTASVDVKGKEISAQNVFNSIPARAEIITLIGESKIEYNPDFLNNPEVASKYSLENSRALN